jgi:hypothetical protein
MNTKFLIVALLAGATVTTTSLVALENASAFVGSVSSVSGVAAKKDSPKGYHLDGFKGWDNGYRINDKCSAGRSMIPGSCAPIMPLKQII